MSFYHKKYSGKCEAETYKKSGTQFPLTFQEPGSRNSASVFFRAFFTLFFLFFKRSRQKTPYSKWILYKKWRKYNEKISEKNSVRGKGIHKIIHAGICSLLNFYELVFYYKGACTAYSVGRCWLFPFLRGLLYFADPQRKKNCKKGLTNRKIWL